ncbi:heavy metal translocating P-type ATPase [Anopheles sinensis]|uniref:Heavy metal translocating P-type ATPase n=1 Tax=Anopheles sinensis TaxID=74873 RepID=A0A084VC36_ANOSI|nr:heavy metal translocating P-type ATPase [Anopheles sinensis]
MVIIQLDTGYRSARGHSSFCPGSGPGSLRGLNYSAFCVLGRFANAYLHLALAVPVLPVAVCLHITFALCPHRRPGDNWTVNSRFASRYSGQQFAPVGGEVCD